MALAGLAGAADGAAADQPNVLVIMPDDMRADDLRSMPKTRRAFAGGIRYRNAYATTPLCCPSRTTIFTGQYTHNHGVWMNYNHPDAVGQPWPVAAHTWPVALDAAGYRTALAGRYMNSWDKLEGTNPPGFDSYTYFRNHDPRADPGASAALRRFVARDSDSPWAAVMSLRSPHDPYTPLPRFQRAPVRPFPASPAWGEVALSDKAPEVNAEAHDDKPTTRRWHRGRSRELRATDQAIARLLRKVGDDALVILLSDNGWLLGENGLSGKPWPYENSIRVPMMLRWPGHVEAGTEDRTVANVDVAATIYEAIGIEPAVEQDGVSLLSDVVRERLFLESAEDNTTSWEAMLDDNRYYIRWGSGWVEDYDLDSDPFTLQASNVPDPAAEAQLDQAAACAGPGCVYDGG